LFDKTFTLASTDGTVSLQITAGTEGVKSIELISPPFPPKSVTSQELIDLLTPAIREWFANAPPAPNSAA
jgi:hypothetical protein